MVEFRNRWAAIQYNRKAVNDLELRLNQALIDENQPLIEELSRRWRYCKRKANYNLRMLGKPEDPIIKLNLDRLFEDEETQCHLNNF